LWIVVVYIVVGVGGGIVVVGGLRGIVADLSQTQNRCSASREIPLDNCNVAKIRDREKDKGYAIAGFVSHFVVVVVLLLLQNKTKKQK